MISSAGSQPSTHAAQMHALAQACQSLWTATLSLMTAFMQTTAPAHRLLLARRIARNFATLQDQPCFNGATRASFARLHERWSSTVDRLTPGYHEAGPLGWLRKHLPN